MWFGTVYGLFCCDGRQFTRCPAGLDTGQGCAAILEDRAGYLWTGTGMRWDAAGTGLRRYDGQEWTTFTPADGLASDLACALAEDQLGRVGVGGG